MMEIDLLQIICPKFYKYYKNIVFLSLYAIEVKFIIIDIQQMFFIFILIKKLMADYFD